MATRTNYAANSSFEVNLDGWNEYNPDPSLTSWRDTSSWNGGASGASLRINNSVVGDYGRVRQFVLAPGKYNASIFRQVLPNTVNASFVVRKAVGLAVLVQKNAASHNAWNRTDGDFELTSETVIEVLLGVGSYGAKSAGSARWDRLQITSGFGVQPYFDGSFQSTSQVTYAWEGTPHNSRSTATDTVTTTPPSGGSSGGGVVNPPGWDLVYSTDFDGNALDSRWGLPYDGPSTNGEGTWDPSRVVVADGMLRIQGVGLEAGGVPMYPGQKYGRWDVRLRTSNGDYHPVALLWSDVNDFSKGEIDFSETSNGTSSSVFIHDTQGNPTANVASTVTSLDRTQWHVYTVEWLPGRITVYVDGVQVLNYTGSNGNPNVPMHLVFQLDMGNHSTPQPYNMDVDWVRIYSPSNTSSPPPVVVPPNPSSDTYLAGRCEQIFAGHIKHFLRPDGGVKQLEADNKVTSEGTPYLGMEAVQFGDRETFDHVEDFAMNVLERHNWVPGGPDGWRDGTNNDPRILMPNGMAWDFRQSPFNGNPADKVWDWNFATDAEVDRITSLLWAAARFNDVKYLNRALEIGRQLKLFGGNVASNGLWYQHTDEYQQSGIPNSQAGRLPGHHIFEGAAQVELNGSYFNPVTCRLLGDRANDSFWTSQALPGGYDLLTKQTNSTGGGSLDTSVGLLPDWAAFDYTTLEPYALTSGVKGWGNTRSTDYKYDAFRWVHRLAWAVDFYGDAAALTLLQGALKTFYAAQWTANGKIAAEYSHTGTPLSGGYEKAMMTAGAYLSLTAGDPDNETAAAIYDAKLKPDDRFSVDSQGFAFWNDYPGSPVNYFTDFWMQFFYMRKAGLWQNWGQTAPGGGGTESPTQLGFTARGTGTGRIRITTRTELALAGIGRGFATVQPSAPINLSFIAKGTGTAQVRIGTSEPDPGTPTTPTVPIKAPREKYLVISPDGFEISFDNYEHGFNVMRGVSGRGAPKPRSNAIIIPGQGGQYTTYVEHEPRTLSMSVRALANSSEGLWDRIRLLIDNLDSPSKDGRNLTLRHIDRDGNINDLFCRCVSGLEVTDEEMSGLTSHVLPLVFVADDPYWYGPEINQSFQGGQAPSWNRAPLRLAASAVMGDITIVTDSAVPTYPIWTIIGPGGVPRFVRKTKLSEFRFGESALLGTGGKIIVNTQTKEVLGPDGSNWFPRLVKHSLWPLLPGVNEITASMVGTVLASFIGVTYRDRKLRT